MCEICEKVKTIDFFPTPKDYLECLDYIQSLVDSGSFVFESKDCDTDRVKDTNGYWIDDVISHVIKCKNCGQCFTCSIITYRGSGSFKKVNNQTEICGVVNGCNFPKREHFNAEKT